MKIKLSNPISGKTRIARATLTTDHCQSHYGQPVLLIDGEPMDALNWVLQGAQIVEPPKQKKQIAMLNVWLANIALYAGL